MTPEIEADLEGISLEAYRIPQRTDKTDGFDKAVHWRVTLSKGERTFSVEYSEGVGLFVKGPYDENRRRVERCILGQDNRYREVYKPVHQYLTKRVKTRFLGTRVLPNTLPALKPPSLEDVMYCLLADSEAHSESFEDWCYNLGWDSDSIKARRCYRACADTWHGLNKLGVDFDSLHEAFQDF